MCGEGGHQKQRECREHHGCADDRPHTNLHTDVSTGGAAGQYCHYGHDGFGQGGSNRGENRTGHALGNLETRTEVFERIGERPGTEQNNKQGNQDQADGHVRLPQVAINYFPASTF